jgi:hypothetical protein
VSIIEAPEDGSFACGYAKSADNVTAKIRAISIGAMAHGFAEGSTALGLGLIEAGSGISGVGAHAFGSARGAALVASLEGSTAFGFADDFAITSSGKGSLAVGWAGAAPIGASADNSFQFGEGVNAVANSLQVGTGSLIKGNGQSGGKNVPVTLGAAAVTFASLSDCMTVTGDGGANTIGTITGGIDGQTMDLIFVDGLVTVTDTDTGAANTISLSAAFVSAARTVLTLLFDGTSWFEKSRSVN